MQPDFNESDRVIHNKFGLGTVIGDRERPKYRIQFDRAGDKNILGSFLRPHEEETSADDNNAPVAANDNLPFINPADWHGQPVPKREWFLDGLIPRRQVTILNGDGGVGKSLLALQIAAASALGCETIGMLPMAGRVLYLGAEDEADE